MRARVQSEQGGFVIVGVVMFVLALTILGLSLFSLSTTEAQFMGNESDDIQAYLSAMAGMQRAEWVITKATNGQLPAVKNNLPPDVVYTRAMYADGSQDSLTQIDWTKPKTVQILVVATHGVATHRVQATFLPIKGPELYRHLFTVYSPDPNAIQVPHLGGTENGVRNTQVYLDGSVWQNSPDTSWALLAQTDVGMGHPIERPLGGVPQPDVASYINAHMSEARQIPDQQGGAAAKSHKWTLNAGSGYAYFTTPSDMITDPTHYTGYFTESGAPPQLQVTGTAIWLVPQGLRFDQPVQVIGANPLTDRLIIVAKACKDDDPVHGNLEAAIWFFGTLQSNIPVFLISDDEVLIEAFNIDATSAVSYLSVYANRVWVLGPTATSGHRMTLLNAVSLAPGTIDPVLDQLYSWGVLPGADPSLGAQLQPVAGTWSESPH